LHKVLPWRGADDHGGLLRDGGGRGQNSEDRKEGYDGGIGPQQIDERTQLPFTHEILPLLWLAVMDMPQAPKSSSSSASSRRQSGTASTTSTPVPMPSLQLEKISPHLGKGVRRRGSQGSGGWNTDQAVASRHSAVFQKEVLSFCRSVQLSAGLWVRWLQCDGAKLGWIPTQINELQRLERWSMRDNQLTSVPPQIGELRQLKLLDLSRNNLKRLPRDIAQCCQLETLNVSQNRLETLPRALSELESLRRLDVSGNRLQELPAELCDCSALEFIYAKDNNLRELMPPEDLAELQNLKVLDVRGNPKISEMFKKKKPENKRADLDILI